MFPALRALVLAIWSALGVRSPDAAELADVAAQVVLEDAANAPVYGSHGEDLAILAVYLEAESGVQVHPAPHSWDAKAGVSCGAWQVPCFVARSQSLLNQGRYVLRLMRRGLVVCPEQPLAPVLGGCKAGRPGADARVEKARRLLRYYSGARLPGNGDVD